MSHGAATAIVSGRQTWEKQPSPASHRLPVVRHWAPLVPAAKQVPSAGHGVPLAQKSPGWQDFPTAIGLTQAPPKPLDVQSRPALQEDVVVTMHAAPSAPNGAQTCVLSRHVELDLHGSVAHEAPSLATFAEATHVKSVARQVRPALQLPSSRQAAPAVPVATQVPEPVVSARQNRPSAQLWPKPLLQAAPCASPAMQPEPLQKRPLPQWGLACRQMPFSWPSATQVVTALVGNSRQLLSSGHPAVGLH
jgi:hypothetical protein